MVDGLVGLSVCRALWFAGFGALVGLVGGFFCLLLGGLAWFGLVCWLFVCSSC